MQNILRNILGITPHKDSYTVPNALCLEIDEIRKEYNQELAMLRSKYGKKFNAVFEKYSIHVRYI